MTIIPVTFKRIKQVTPTIRVLTLDLRGKEFLYKSVQWIDCYAVIDGERKIVGYSLASSPATIGSIEVAVKESDNPVTEYVHSVARARGDSDWSGHRSGASHGNITVHRRFNECICNTDTERLDGGGDGVLQRGIGDSGEELKGQLPSHGYSRGTKRGLWTGQGQHGEVVGAGCKHGFTFLPFRAGRNDTGDGRGPEVYGRARRRISGS